MPSVSWSPNFENDLFIGGWWWHFDLSHFLFGTLVIINHVCFNQSGLSDARHSCVQIYVYNDRKVIQTQLVLLLGEINEVEKCVWSVIFDILVVGMSGMSELFMFCWSTSTFFKLDHIASSYVNNVNMLKSF